MMLAMLIWSVVCAVTFMLRPRRRRLRLPDLLQGVCSGRSGSLFEIAYVLFVILILAVFGAAAGAIGAATLGLPVIAGTLALAVAIALFVAFGNASVERLFK